MYSETEKRILEQAEWKLFFKSSTLLIFAFATVFFPRVLSNIGVPSPVNFLHFIVVPIACALVLLKAKTKQRERLTTVKTILLGLGLFLCVELVSAILSRAGAINVALSYMLLAEPFMLLIALISIPAYGSIQKFKAWFIRFHILHILLALAQRFLLNYHRLNEDLGDNIQGVFFKSGSGHVVGTSVSIVFALYFLLTAKARPLWQRLAIMAGALVQLQVSDAKQVVVVTLSSFILLAILKGTNIKRLFLYLFLASFSIGLAYWSIYQFEILQAYRTWIRPELYGLDGEATQLKIQGVRIILSHQSSILDSLFGMGPGHTIGRLGGWMMGKYESFLAPLGATQTTIGAETWKAVGESWLGDRSSFFSPLWGWAGIWGDIGFVGLGSYLFLWWIVWQRICKGDFSRFLVINVFLHGLIFSQMEEPGYMLSTMVFIGLQAHEPRME